MAEPFKDNTEHLLAELGCLDLLIRREVLRSRASVRNEHNMFKGMYISDADVDNLLDDPIQPLKGDADELYGRAASYALEVEARKRASLEKGVPLRLPYVATLFGLNAFEQRILLLCLAPEIDPKYERLFGYLHDDISRRRPTVGLALALCCFTAGERIEVLKTFSARAPLFRAGLLKTLNQTEETFLRRTLLLDEMVLNYLLGMNASRSDFDACAWLFSAPRPLEELRWQSQFKKELAGFLRQHLEPGPRKRVVMQFHGPYGTGKKALAGALCHAVGIPLLIVDTPELLRRFSDAETGLCAVFRHALLFQAAVFLDHFECLAGEDGKLGVHRQMLRRLIEEISLITFLGTESPWAAGDSLGEIAYVSVELPMADAEEREQIWAKLACEARLEDDIRWEDIASKFRLTPGRIKSAFHFAATLASVRKPQGGVISLADVYRGCYSQSNRKLATLAQKVLPRHTWEDLILPANALSQLREICSQLKHRQCVYQKWGFERKLARGKGLCALFYGHSGVGKTMSVEVLAHDLHLEVFKIDLSTVVSKYIGETEKNLSKIFQEAEDSNSILFFDEADALFGKRSEVKDAHDRYANIEINYLLQRMEDFDGLVVLATNMRRNIDEGFFRRMHFAVEFPFPDEKSRYHIWKRHFPQAAPLGPDVDFDYLAKRFALAGGNIRNVAVNAAFLAASNSGTIHMEHVIRATKREYEKIGKLCTENEFAPYQWALRELPAELDQAGKS